MIHVLDSYAEATGPTLAERMHQAFSPDGLLGKSQDFEFRPQQQRMAEQVASALETNRPVVIEAATGVGKSLAYLLPAVTHAVENDRKAIICTHTINLQEQLISKDIPIVRKIVGRDFKAELLKGRSNYLCPNRLGRAFKDTPDLFTSTEQADLKLIYEWSMTTQDGTLSSLSFTPSQRVWSLVCSEAHACTPRRCGIGSGCFYQAARRRMAEADVVILNHTLFFTLLSSAEELLPEDANFLFPRDFVILDEAHTIENIAAKQFGIHVSESNIRFELGRLFNPRTRKGFFTMLGEEGGIREVQQCLDMAEGFFRDAEAACNFQGFAKEFRVREPGLVDDTLSLSLQRVANATLKAGDAAKTDSTRNELHDIGKRLVGLKASIGAFLEQSEEGHVYWTEKSGGDNKTVSFHSAPIDVAPKLRQIFFTGTKACVFTSATLGVTDDEELNYFRNRVGAQQVAASCINSPFDFQKQMRLYLVKTMPMPGTKEFEPAMVKWISHFLDMTKGRAFVLFTS